MEQDALWQVQAQKQAAQREKLEQRLAVLQRELAQGKEKVREQFEWFASGQLKQQEFSTFQQRYKGQTTQQMQEMTAIQGQMAELGGKGKDYKPISLTATMKNAIINRNGIEISLELLDGLIREVRVGSDGAVDIEWEFSKD